VWAASSDLWLIIAVATSQMKLKCSSILWR